MAEGAVSKFYITPTAFRLYSYSLASLVLNDGFEPDFMVALWRGGAPVGCYVHEYLKWHNLSVDHIAIRTSKYTGIDSANSTVEIHNLGYLNERLVEGSKILLIDDVWDSGHTIDAFIDKITRENPTLKLDIRVATVYYKPSRNQSKSRPDYFVEESDAWLVFPHELEGMTKEEVISVMGDSIGNLLK